MLLPMKIVAFAAFLRWQALSECHFGFGGSLSSCTAAYQYIYTWSCIWQPSQAADWRNCGREICLARVSLIIAFWSDRFDHAGCCVLHCRVGGTTRLLAISLGAILLFWIDKSPRLFLMRDCVIFERQVATSSPGSKCCLELLLKVVEQLKQKTMELMEATLWISK